MSRSSFLQVCGGLGLLGCLGLIAGNVAGVMVVEKHDLVADTISDLAAGRHAWIQDAGLIIHAIGLMACGAAVWRWRADPRRWRVAAALLALMGVVLIVIAGHNEYGDNDSEKYEIHRYAVYVFGVLFAFTPALLARGLRPLGRAWWRLNVATSVFWVAFAPYFFLIPTAWDGAYERGLAVILLGWMILFCGLLIRQGRRQAL